MHREQCHTDVLWKIWFTILSLPLSGGDWFSFILQWGGTLPLLSRLYCRPLSSSAHAWLWVTDASISSSLHPSLHQSKNSSKIDFTSNPTQLERPKIQQKIRQPHQGHPPTKILLNFTSNPWTFHPTPVKDPTLNNKDLKSQSTHRRKWSQQEIDHLTIWILKTQLSSTFQ